jgi:hypothetical protein
MVGSLSLSERRLLKCGGGKCPQTRRCGVKSVTANLSYLASYARFAIHIGKFSPELQEIVQCTRNKIAQGGLSR